MKTKEVRGLVREIIVDLDNALAGVTKSEEDRHSAAASALMLSVHLLGGIAINQARIAHALEVISYNTTPEDPADEQSDGDN